jgi:hypothetical protein
MEFYKKLSHAADHLNLTNWDILFRHPDTAEYRRTTEPLADMSCTHHHDHEIPQYSPSGS